MPGQRAACAPVAPRRQATPRPPSTTTRRPLCPARRRHYRRRRHAHHASSLQARCAPPPPRTPTSLFPAARRRPRPAAGSVVAAQTAPKPAARPCPFAASRSVNTAPSPVEDELVRVHPLSHSPVMVRFVAQPRGDSQGACTRRPAKLGRLRRRAAATQTWAGRVGNAGVHHSALPWRALPMAKKVGAAPAGASSCGEGRAPAAAAIRGRGGVPARVAASSAVYPT